MIRSSMNRDPGVVRLLPSNGLYPNLGELYGLRSDNTAKQVVLPGTRLLSIGVAILAAGNGATTVRVRPDWVSTETA